MLDYILDLVERSFYDLSGLSKKEKELIFDHVSFALSQTKAHISTTRKNASDKSSTILSNIWQRTANNIRSINSHVIKELIHTIDEKSKYWADPQSYNKDQFDKYNMRIKQVDSKLNELCK